MRFLITSLVLLFGSVVIAHEPQQNRQNHCHPTPYGNRPHINFGYSPYYAPYPYYHPYYVPVQPVPIQPVYPSPFQFNFRF